MGEDRALRHRGLGARSGWRESNPHSNLGGVFCNHYNTPAGCQSAFVGSFPVAVSTNDIALVRFLNEFFCGETTQHPCHLEAFAVGSRWSNSMAKKGKRCRQSVHGTSRNSCSNAVCSLRRRLSVFGCPPSSTRRAAARVRVRAYVHDGSSREQRRTSRSHSTAVRAKPSRHAEESRSPWEHHLCGRNPSHTEGTRHRSRCRARTQAAEELQCFSLTRADTLKLLFAVIGVIRDVVWLLTTFLHRSLS